LGPVGPVTKTADIRMPLMDYVISPTDMAVTLEAQRVLIMKCVKRFGVKSTYPKAMGTPPDGINLVVARRYGVVDMAEAQRYAFDAPPQPDVISDDKGGPGSWNPSAKEARITQGRGGDGPLPPDKDDQGKPVPAQGCAGEAWDTLTNGHPPDNNAVLGLFNETAAAERNDSRLKAAQREWSTCMSAKGYKYSVPSDAGDAASKKPGPEQQATAIAYVECSQKVNLPGIWNAVDVAYQKVAIAKNEGTLRELRSRREETLNRAKAIVQAGV